MRKAGWIVLIYGILVVTGGWIGHLKAGSIMSLIAGVSSGVLLLLCAWAIFKNKLAGLYAALVLTFLLDAFFTYRFAHSLKFMPSGMMGILSLVVLIILALKLFTRIQNKR